MIRGVWVVIVLVVVFSVLALAFTPQTPGGDFYAAIPHGVMVGIFGVTGVLVLVSWGIGLGRFWKEDRKRPPVSIPALLEALRDILSLSNLSSHGAGCTYPNEHHSQARRVFHHFTFYGFMLCFASTSVAAVYDNFFGWKAPYDYLSVPVVLGALGGVGIIAGPLGLLALKIRRDRRIVDPSQDGMDLSFIGLLLASGITGLALMGLRGTAAMSSLLAIHLAVVLALFVTLPFGKFVHGIYRSAALFRNALEQRRRDQS